MAKPPTLLQEAARLRDEAERILRLTAGLSLATDRALFNDYARELRGRAETLEREAAAQTPQRPAEPDRDATNDEPKPKRGRGGSNDPEPQA